MGGDSMNAMLKNLFPAIVFSALCVLLVPCAAVCDGRPGPEMNAVLIEGIEANFAGDYDRATAVFGSIEQIDPDHPAQEFYQATVLFWRNSADPSNPKDDAEIERLLNRSIGKSQAWLDQGENQLEALQYLGLAYTYLGRLEAQRGRLYSGGTKGEKGRVYLEQALEICSNQSPETRQPVCEDVYFPLGAYTYFAGRLPGLLRKLNFLWFVPRGTTKEGLNALDQSRRNSVLHHWGSTFLLMQIYSIFEGDKRTRALDFSAELRSRFPDNPIFDLEHAILLNRLARHKEAAASAQAILRKYGQGTRNDAAMVDFSAGLIIAEADIEQGKLEQADKRLRSLGANPLNQGNTLTPRITLLRGMLADAQGNRKQALALYKKTIGYKGISLNRQASKEAKRFMLVPYRNNVVPQGPGSKGEM